MGRNLHAPDAIAGGEGTAYAKINGSNEELFFLRNLDAKVTKKKSTIPAIGKRMVGHKTTGGEGTGSMSIYYMTPIFREMLQEWKRTGKDVYFEIVVTNSDAGSSVGDQTVMLADCNLDEVTLALLDATADDALTEDIPFTFDDFDILTPFKRI